jgi:hypothetical protein
MNQLERNLRASFRDVKLEMTAIKGQILQIAESQKELRALVLELEKESAQKSKKKAVKAIKAEKKSSKKRK